MANVSFKFEDELYPLHESEVAEHLESFKVIEELISTSRGYKAELANIKTIYTDFSGILKNTNYVEYYSKFFKMGVTKTLYENIESLSKLIDNQLKAINFERSLEDDYTYWHGKGGVENLEITNVFRDEIVAYDKTILGDFDVSFPSNIDECKQVGKDLYIHFYLVMDRNRPRNSQVKSNREIFIKNGVTKYNRMLKKAQAESVARRAKRLEEKKMNRYKTVDNLRSKMYALNRLINVLQTVTYHSAIYMYSEKADLTQKGYHYKNEGVYGAVQKLIDKVDRTMNAIVVLNSNNILYTPEKIKNFI